LSLSRRRQKSALVVLQQFHPVADVSGMIAEMIRRQPEMRAKD
jgi:Na+/H+-translocating membrane pyrophosphatase